jgi:hypothetical protein
MHYEVVLNKIAPLFYKFIKYELYFESNKYFIRSYLVKAELPRLHYVYLPLDMLDIKYFSMQSIKNTIYDYYTGFHSIIIDGKELNIITAVLNEKYKLKIWSYFASFSEFIVNLIINNFSFEDEHIFISENLTNIITKTYKDLFIALVGKELYDAIRISVK